MLESINLWAILASAVASMIIGSIWYGPLFGKIFMNEMGMNHWTSEQQEKMKKTMAVTYLVQFLASIVMFYVLGWFMVSLNQLSLLGGIQIALWIWIGFIVPLKLGDALWGGKMILFWLSIGNMGVTILTAGAIIGTLH